MSEVWRSVDGFDGRYEVSSEGRVRSHFKSEPLIMSQRIRRGYLSVGLRDKNGKSHDATVHRLVAIAFLGSPNGLHVNHKSGVKTDNRLVNLEYCTPSENMKHAFSMGLQSNKGERHSSAKLTEEKVHQIRLAVAHGEKQSSIARLMGIHQSAVSRVANSKRWQHVTNDRKAG